MTTIILQCKMKATLNRKRKIGIYTLDASLPVKGYYAVGTLDLTMSAFVLQKTIRDNEEDTAHDRKYDKAEEEL